MVSLSFSIESNVLRRNLKLVRERYDNLNVKAPISGQLGTLSVEIGQTVSSGMDIGKINVLDNYKVVAQIDEHYIDRVRKDLAASLERQGTNYEMKVLKVYPDVKGGQFKTDLCFAKKMPENVRTGQTYHINLQLGQSDESVLIPRGAFYQSTGGQWIFVVSPDGTEAHRRPIKIGKQNVVRFHFYRFLISLGEEYMYTVVHSDSFKRSDFSLFFKAFPGAFYLFLHGPGRENEYQEYETDIVRQRAIRLSYRKP